MLAISIVYLISLGVWLYYNHKTANDLFSPANILLFSWIGPVLLRSYRLSGLERDFAIETIFTLGLVSILLAVPCLITNLLVSKHRFAAKAPYFDQIARFVSNPKFLLLLGAIFIVSFVSYVYNEFVTNPIGVPLLSLNANFEGSRDAFNRWGKDSRSLASYLSIPVAVTSVILYSAFRYRDRGSLKYLCLFVSLLYPMCTILKLSRIDFLNQMIMTIFAEYYWRKGRGTIKAFKPAMGSFWKAGIVVGLGLAGIMGMSALSIYRGGFSEKGALGEILQIEAGRDTMFYPAIVESYAYFAMPIDNFAAYFEANEGGGQIGVGMFRPLMSLTGQGPIADRETQKVEIQYPYWPVNTLTFLPMLYAESGLWGVFGGSLAYSVFVNLLYFQFRIHPTFLNIFNYIISSYAWCWLCVTNGFSVLTLYLQMFYVIALYLSVRSLSRVRGAKVPNLSNDPVGSKLATLW